MLTHEGPPSASGARRVAAARSSQPGLGARLLARLRWVSLDRRLAAGEDPSSSVLLTARAARLTSTGQREELADALCGLLRVAESRPSRGRVAPARAALLANQQDVRRLARKLEAQAPVYARGVARLELLVTDSTGTVFRGGITALAEELARAAAELAGSAPVGSVASTAPAPGRSRRLLKLRHLARRGRGRTGPGPALDLPLYTGDSFTLPDGSWFHGRRESA